jgi:hypothetical protein
MNGAATQQMPAESSLAFNPSCSVLTGIAGLVRRAAVTWHGHRTMIFEFLRQNLKKQGGGRGVQHGMAGG